MSSLSRLISCTRHLFPKCLVNVEQEIVRFEGFFEITVSPLPHGLHGGFDGAIPREDNDGRVRLKKPKFFHERDSV